jgi:hypothetical protein
MRVLFVATLAWVAVLRAVWFLEFVHLAVKDAPPTNWPSRIRDEGRRPARLRGMERIAVAQHEQFKTLQTSTYTLGGLALAAWSIAAAADPADASGRFTLGMLSVAVLTALGATLLFRQAGAELGRMGYESGLAIASVATLSAVAELVAQTFKSNWVAVALLTGVAVVVIRDTADSVVQMRLTKRVIFAPTDRLDNERAAAKDMPSAVGNLEPEDLPSPPDPELRQGPSPL